MSASCFFVESSIVDWELLVWDEFCWCNRMDGMMGKIGIFVRSGTKVEGYGQHVPPHMNRSP
jgi:hypothetical protein